MQVLLDNLLGAQVWVANGWPLHAEYPLKRQHGSFYLPLSWETKEITQRKYG